MKLVVANLKMNLAYSDINNYRNKMEDVITDNEIVICPSSLFLPFFKSGKYSLGAQNVYFEDKGSFTGETSPLQLKNMGTKYVIVGHSERRNIFNENNELINKKVNAVIKNNMIPILCVGESKEEKDEKKTYEVIEKQLDECLINVDTNNIVIAYEPIWSIGTGIIPEEKDIENVINYIKEKYNANTKVLYGGSVNVDNVAMINEISNIDGFLIGSASVDISNFINIINKIK